MGEDIAKFVVGTIAVIIGIVAIWGCFALMYWLIANPWDNQGLCEAKAKALNSTNSTTTGWRSDTCYIYIGKEQKVIKL